MNFIIFQLHVTQVLKILKCPITDWRQLIIVKKNFPNLDERMKRSRMNYFDLVIGEIQLDEDR